MGTSSKLFYCSIIFGLPFKCLFFVSSLTSTGSPRRKQKYSLFPHYYFIPPGKYHQRESLKGKIQSDDTSLDPYQILEIPVGTTDKTVIKRAYRRMAMKYHPDVFNSMDSQEKQAANERFIKINAAYELLSGKTAAQNGKPSNTSTKTSTSNGYQPPHRRYYSSTKSSSSTSSSSSTFSDQWKDYIPEDSGASEDNYDAGGDSFGSIFSDFLVGLGRAASGNASGGKGLLMDLIDFLDGNFPEYRDFATGDQNTAFDAILQSDDTELLRNEVYDTTLLIQQLSTKLAYVDREIASLEVEKAAATNFSQREVKEEEIASLKGRKRVVEDYLKRGRKRLIQLQKRLSTVRDDSRYASRDIASTESESRYEGANCDSSSASTSGTSNSIYNDNSRTFGASTDSYTSASTTRETFGPFGRGRSRSRSFHRQTTSTDASSKSPSSGAEEFQKPLVNMSPKKSPPTNVGNLWKRQNDDKKRLRELELDDEFEKLKRELGI
jgi:curved DNA-binding protein CbpA